jgi:hypothetical protein
MYSCRCDHSPAVTPMQRHRVALPAPWGSELPGAEHDILHEAPLACNSSVCCNMQQQQQSQLSQGPPQPTAVAEHMHLALWGPELCDCDQLRVGKTSITTAVYVRTHGVQPSTAIRFRHEGHATATWQTHIVMACWQTAKQRTCTAAAMQTRTGDNGATRGVCCCAGLQEAPATQLTLHRECSATCPTFFYQKMLTKRLWQPAPNTSANVQCSSRQAALHVVRGVLRAAAPYKAAGQPP